MSILDRQETFHGGEESLAGPIRGRPGHLAPGYGEPSTPGGSGNDASHSATCFPCQTNHGYAYNRQIRGGFARGLRLVEVVGTFILGQPRHLYGQSRVLDQIRIHGDQVGGLLASLSDDALVIEQGQQP